MSRAWIAFYTGDYLKKTQRLTTEQHGAYLLLLMECWQQGCIPLDDDSRAAIARLPLARWNKIKGPIDLYFQPDGSQSRATEEIEKAEIVSVRRSIAGRNGGLKSGLSKAIALGQATKREAIAIAKAKQISSICVATNNNKESTSSEVARAPPVLETEESGQPRKQVATLTRVELEESFRRKSAL